MTHGSLFSGIGGFDLAAEWAGWQNLFHCEWNPFGQKVLKHYWPNAQTFTDITKTDFTPYANTIDVLTGGFPCQPYSAAGKRLGKEDDRHLWPQMLRAIQEISPRYIVGENVRGLVNWNGGMVFDEIQADLEAAGYEVLPVILPACAVNAPHRRDRVWFVAYRNSERMERSKEVEQGRGKRKCFGSEIWSENRTTCSSGATSNTHDTRAVNAMRTDKNGAAANERREIKPLAQLRANSGATQNPNSIRCNGGIGKEESEIGQQREYVARTHERVQNTPYAHSPRLQTPGAELKTAGVEQHRELVTEYATNASSFKLQRGKLNRSLKGSGQIQTKSRQFSRPVCNAWQDFPTQSPVRSRNDGLSRKLVSYIEIDFYDTISNTSKKNRIKNLLEVWSAVQQEEVWKKIRRLYSLESKEVLLQTMQLYSESDIRQVELSPFSENFSTRFMRTLQKHGEFGCTSQGRELQKQREVEYPNLVPQLPHEVALAARRFETELLKFDAWHRAESIKAYGNAIVPQVAYEIFKVINQLENNSRT